jgi:N6-L-threonylcarbamoyladenine synthase
LIVLGIESSCDETAAALLEDGRTILSSVVASQIAVHRPFGGVVPELASREHVDNICYAVDACFKEASTQGRPIGWSDIHAIAVTQGPGLIGALMVGLMYAKAAAFALKIPFLGVNHLEGHIASVFLEHPDTPLPALSLVVSGGHTSLYYLRRPTARQELARTGDDAAGEALDKLAKHLGLGYPGGPVIERLARHGNPNAVRFPLPRFNAPGLHFSFSGIKSSAVRYADSHGISAVTPEATEAPESLPRPLLDLVASYQGSVIDQLIKGIEGGLESREVAAIHVSGGVSCNAELRRRVEERFEDEGLPVYFPRTSLTTDNAAMIAAAAFLRASAGERAPWDLSADPNLALGD